MIYRTLLSGVVLSTLAACASQPPPTRHLGSALAAASAAQEAGASRVPPAALHLALAREQLEQAERMIEDGMNERANDLTVRAYNDAKLAAALAHEAKLKEKLEEWKRETDPAMMPSEDAQAPSSKRPEQASAAPAAAAKGTPGGTSVEQPDTAESPARTQQRAKNPGVTQPEEN